MIDTMTDAAAPRRGILGRRMLAVTCLLVAAAVGGCSGSTGKAAHDSTGRAPVGTDVASGVNGSAATEITTAYLRFFDPTIAQSERLHLIQDGAQFSQAISLQEKSEFAKAVSIQVTKVTVTSANKATVIFTKLVDGSPPLPNQTGHAVHEDGRWKVAGATFCALLATQGALPQVCTVAAATTLPS